MVAAELKGKFHSNQAMATMELIEVALDYYRSHSIEFQLDYMFPTPSV